MPASTQCAAEAWEACACLCEGLFFSGNTFSGSVTLAGIGQGLEQQECGAGERSEERGFSVPSVTSNGMSQAPVTSLWGAWALHLKPALLLQGKERKKDWGFSVFILCISCLFPNWGALGTAMPEGRVGAASALLGPWRKGGLCGWGWFKDITHVSDLCSCPVQRECHPSNEPCFFSEGHRLRLVRDSCNAWLIRSSNVGKTKWCRLSPAGQSGSLTAGVWGQRVQPCFAWCKCLY